MSICKKLINSRGVGADHKTRERKRKLKKKGREEEEDEAAVECLRPWPKPKRPKLTLLFKNIGVDKVLIFSCGMLFDGCTKWERNN